MNDYKKIIKEELSNYKFNKVKFNLFKLDLEEIQLSNDITNEKKIKDLEYNIEQYEVKINQVINLLKVLDNTEKAFIILKYFECKSHKEIANKLNLNYQSVGVFNDIIVAKIVNSIYNEGL